MRTKTYRLDIVHGRGERLQALGRFSSDIDVGLVTGGLPSDGMAGRPDHACAIPTNWTSVSDAHRR